MSKDIYLNCSYIPPELFTAANYNPIRLWPEKVGQSGQNLIPVDICPYTRALLSQLYNDKKAVLVNSCDGMRRLYDIVTDNSFLLQVPRKSGVREVNYYYQQLLRLLDYLDIDYNNNYRQILKNVIIEYNTQRKLLRKLQFNKSPLLLINGIKIYTNYLQGDIKELFKKSESKKAVKNLPSILLTGSCLLDGQIINLIDKNDLNLTAVDSCLGERSFNTRVNIEKDKDPLKVLAESYLQKTACPRSMEVERRLIEINSLVKSRKIDGIIYFTPKFCDQASYDFKLIKGWSKQKNIPVLNLEGEYMSGQSGQLNTRIAAFRESLIM